MTRINNELSNRQKKFVERNTIEPNNGCYSHIKNILETNDINNYDIKIYNNQYALFLYFGKITYIINLDVNCAEIKIIQRNEMNNKLRVIGKYNSDSCWIDSIDSIMLFEKDVSIR